jgi:predicted nucleic acid-binding Zn ribbon protein
MPQNGKKYPEGHFIGMWIGIGIAIFSGIGIPLSIATDNPGLIAIGPAIGVSIGVAIGSSIETKNKKEGKIRPLTEDEKKSRKRSTTIALIILAIALITLTVFLIKFL